MTPSRPAAPAKLAATFEVGAVAPLVVVGLLPEAVVEVEVVVGPEPEAEPEPGADPEPPVPVAVARGVEEPAVRETAEFPGMRMLDVADTGAKSPEENKAKSLAGTRSRQALL